MSLDRTSLLAALARKIVEVEVPEVGTLHVKEMTVRERVAMSTRLYGPDGKGTATNQDYALALVHACLCDEAGDELLSLEDLEVLRDSSQAKLEAIATHVIRINGLGVAEAADAKELETNGEEYICYHLAESLGMTVTRLKAEMPSSEFTGWMAYYKVKAKQEQKRELEREAKRGLAAMKSGRRH